jgi:hypothetical protein
VKLAAILEHLLSSLDSAASKAAETSPVLVFESLLVSVVLIILFANGLNHRCKMRRLETEERQAVLQMLERLNLGRSATVKAVPLLRWLRIGRRE